MPVHHRLRLLAFPVRARDGRAALARHEISRFPRKERPHMPGSQTAPGRTGARNSAPVRVAFRQRNSVGAQEESFRGSMAGLCDPLPTLRLHPRGHLRTARGRCGLLCLHRSGLSPPTPCRSPGALRTPTQAGGIEAGELAPLYRCHCAVRNHSTALP